MNIDLLDCSKFVVVDLEGNGQNPPDIVEIAVQPISLDDEVMMTGKSWLVKPPRKINVFAQRIHHISNSDVEKCPSWNDIKKDVYHSIRDKIVIAHNASVERKVLSLHLPEWQPEIILDTLKLSRATWKNLNSYSLDALIKSQNLTPNDDKPIERHRAGGDAYVTAILFLKLIKDSEVKTERELFELGNILSNRLDTEPKQYELF